MPDAFVHGLAACVMTDQQLATTSTYLIAKSNAATVPATARWPRPPCNTCMNSAIYQLNTRLY